MRLTPRKEAALHALAISPLDRTEEGWISRKGAEGLFNSHTVRWLADRQFCSISSSKKSASINPKGLHKIGMPVDYAA